MFFISVHTYKKLYRENENEEKENVSCIAVFQISFLADRESSEAWGEGNPKN